MYDKNRLNAFLLFKFTVNNLYLNSRPKEVFLKIMK